MKDETLQLKEAYRALEKAQRNYEVMREWLYSNQLGYPICRFFLRRHYQKIVVYGGGEIGLLLCQEILSQKQLMLQYVIDQKQQVLPLPVKVYQCFQHNIPYDIIVVTPDFDYSMIRNELVLQGAGNIVSIKDVIINA